MSQLQWLTKLSNKIRMVEENTGQVLTRENSQLLREVMAEIDSERETLMRMFDDKDLN